MDDVNTVVDLVKEAVAGIMWQGDTKKYCAVITLHVGNAFNSAQWQYIIRSLTQLNVPMCFQLIVRDYFMDRKFLYDIDAGSVEHLVKGGLKNRCWICSGTWWMTVNSTSNDPEQVLSLAKYTKFLLNVVWACQTSVRLLKDWMVSHGIERGNTRLNLHQLYSSFRCFPSL